MAQTTDEFVDTEVLPKLEQLETKDWDLARRLIRRCGELGLLGVNVPEQYGGLDLDKVSSLIVAERIARSASFATSYGGQANLCILPHRPLRHRRAEAEVPAEAGQRRARRRLRAERIRIGLGRARGAHPRHQSGRRIVDAERREDVDHQRRIRRRDHRLCQGRRRALHGLHRRKGVPGRQRRQGRAQDGTARVVDDADRAAGCEESRRATCSAKSARATRSRSTR